MWDDVLLKPMRTRGERQKEITRKHIVRTALALIHEGGEGALTMRAVANAAEITERTVFRHFGNRDVLLQAVWDNMAELIAGPQGYPVTANALVERPRSLFPQLQRMGRYVRAYLHRSERQNAPTQPDYGRQDLMVRCIAQELADLDHRTLRRRAAIAQVITSAYAWEMMQEFWEFSGLEAGEAAAEALEILLGRRRPD